MSLILDALNRSDREHENKNRVPDLHTVHGQAHESPQREHTFYWVIAAIAGVVIAVLLAVIVALLWFADDQPAPANTVDATQQQSADSAQEPVNPRPLETSPVDEPGELKEPAGPERSNSDSAPVTDVSDEVSALYEADVDPEPTQIVEPDVAPAPTVIQPTDKGVESTVDRELARQLWDEARKEMRRPSESSKPKPEPEPEPVAQTVDAPLEETLTGFPDIPFLHELPVNFQNTIPTLMYAEHEYNAGTITVNKTMYSEGDEIAGAIEVDRILADGVLLRFNGREFKLASLSSWVNY